jgi:hypothetical protein
MARNAERVYLDVGGTMVVLLSSMDRPRIADDDRPVVRVIAGGVAGARFVGHGIPPRSPMPNLVVAVHCRSGRHSPSKMRSAQSALGVELVSPVGDELVSPVGAELVSPVGAELVSPAVLALGLSSEAPAAVWPPPRLVSCSQT